MVHIHKRKRRIPKPKPGVTVKFVHTKPPELPKHERRRRELHEQYPEIPLEDIFVDSQNGVELFRNPVTGGWCYTPDYILEVRRERTWTKDKR